MGVRLRKYTGVRGAGVRLLALNSEESIVSCRK